jgi:MFS transporter, CP family, cyanate transporter
LRAVLGDQTRARNSLWFAAILLVAANLRLVIGSVPPVAEQLAASLGLNSVGTGVLTTLPVICMAIFAPTAAVLAGRFGERVVVIASVASIGLGAAGRAVPGVIFLYVGTALAGVGIAVAGVLLPGLVRARMPQRVGPVTGLYSCVLIGGALISSGATEPVRAALSASPQAILAIWAVPAAVAVAFWVAVPGLAASTVERVVIRPPWRSGAAWRASVFMGAQSMLFYAALAWLAARYTELGFSPSAGGLLLAVFSAAQMVTALAMPSLAHRGRSVSGWIAASVGLTTIGLLLVGVVPLGSPWVWVSVIGLGMGGNLALALLVITNAAPDPRAATAYTGMAFLVGYLLAAVGPVAAGALRDQTGNLTSVFVALTGLGVITLLLGVAAAIPSGGSLPAAEPSLRRP